MDGRKCLAFSLTVIVAVWLAAPALATKYRHYANREIVNDADLVIAGTITAIIGPPKVGDKDAISVAVVRVERVFKGDVKPGADVRFVYWSHSGWDRGGMNAPDKYQVGEKLVLPLRRNPDRFTGYAGPDIARQTPWIGWEPRYVYEKQIQSEAFRNVAEAWREPEKHLENPKVRGDAVFFMAVQQRLPKMLLLQFLYSDDVGDQRAGCWAARIAKTNAALPPLVAILERINPTIVSWNDNSQTERERLMPVYRLHEEAHAALSETPIDGALDGPVLLRLARCGEMGDELIVRLLQAGPARWHATKGLREAMNTKARLDALPILHALDARAAFEPLRVLTASPDDDVRFSTRTLVNEYQNAWAQRFVFEHARELARGHGVVEQFYILRRSFGFTHQTVDPDERRKAGEKSQGWDASYAELRKYAQAQLALTEKKGPSFAELPKRLEAAEKRHLHRVGAAASTELTKAQWQELTALVVRNADPVARDLDPRAEAAWFVDLYNPSYQTLPIGQLWIAADGTFGFGWLPDRAWGKSAKLPATLGRWLDP